MSAANGMWYQSESKLKIPRSSACFVVSAQWRDHERDHADHDQQRQPLAGGSCRAGTSAVLGRGASGRGAPAPPRPAGQSATAAASRDAGADEGPGVEELEGAEDLGDPDQQGDRDDRLDQAGRCALPGGQQPPAQPEGAEAQREDDDGQLERLRGGRSRALTIGGLRGAAQSLRPRTTIGVSPSATIPWARALRSIDDRVVGGLDPVVEARVLVQQLVQLGFGRGRRRVGLDEVDRRVQVGVEDGGEDEGQRDRGRPGPS